MKIFVPSRGRFDAPKNGVGKICPDATWIVSESEKDDYKVPAKRKIVVPDDRQLHTEKCNFVLENFDAEKEPVVIIDDDITSCVCMVGRKSRRYTDPKTIRAILESTAIVSREAGAKLFAFWPNLPNPTFFHANKFINFKILCCRPWGVHSNDLRMDESLVVHTDFDFTMQHLLKNRYVWADTRFYFEEKYRGQKYEKGGLQMVRTSEVEAEAQKKLKKKWGGCIRLSKKGGIRTETFAIAVNRKQ